jgi:hypothetical protein
MALVVVAGALGGSREQWQDRLGSVQRLDLTLFIHAQHYRPLGRVQIQAADVLDLVNEQRVLGELERLLAVRLEPERLPDPQDRVVMPISAAEGVRLTV